MVGLSIVVRSKFLTSRMPYILREIEPPHITYKNSNYLIVLKQNNNRKNYKMILEISNIFCSFVVMDY